MIGALLLIAQLSIVVHAPDNASPCDAMEISVAASAPGNVAPEVVPPSFSPFDVLQSSPLPHVTYDPSAGTSVAEYRYVLTTDHTGVFSIAPFEARIGASSVRSRMVQIVVEQTGRPSLPVVVARARIDTSLDVDVRALARPETVFVGQQANYEVAVFLNQTVRDRLRRNPTFFPPDMQSMLAYDLPAHGGRHGELGSRCFDALVYERALFPLMPGRFSIPPAQLAYSLPLSASFFSREESHELETDSTVVVAVDPPQSGRPSDYGGAVGDLRLAAKLDTAGSRVGDPMLLTLRVSGTGNVKLFPRPAVSLAWATLVQGDERVRVDSTAKKIGGSKEFDWVLTPHIAGDLDLPPIRYSYFNPDARRYEMAETDPEHVHIGPGTLASADTARTETLLALRPRYRGVPSAPLHERPVFWVFLALATIPALSLGSRDRRRATDSRVLSPAARLTELGRDADAVCDPCELRRVYTLALADRLALNPESFTRAGGMARALRRRGVSTAVAVDAEAFLRDLDAAAFARNGALAPGSTTRAAGLFAAIDAEALPRMRIGATAVGIVILLVVGVATAQAFDAPAAQRAFDEGVALYQRHNFVAARESFVAAVTAEPRAPDAWANLGTASWAVADTAGSVAAWQRALRIEPLAADMRDRAELVHALPWNSAGYVIPLPVSAVFDLAAILWCLAWGTAAYRAWRGRSFASRELATLSTIAIVVAIGGFALADRSSGRHAAVVRRTVSLRSDPDLGGERGPMAIIGEVVRVRNREGAWSRVLLDDGRTGWVEDAALISLDPRDASQMGS